MANWRTIGFANSSVATHPGPCFMPTGLGQAIVSPPFRIRRCLSTERGIAHSCEGVERRPLSVSFSLGDERFDGSHIEHCVLSRFDNGLWTTEEGEHPSFFIYFIAVHAKQ
jgi:hypothetical protein